MSSACSSSLYVYVEVLNHPGRPVRSDRSVWLLSLEGISSSSPRKEGYSLKLRVWRVF